jgi:hypothetical protein
MSAPESLELRRRVVMCHGLEVPFNVEVGGDVVVDIVVGGNQEEVGDSDRSRRPRENGKSNNKVDVFLVVR